MVVGKAGRAETPTDPAPMDMIETMVNFRPREFWPRRKLRRRRCRRPGPCGARRPDGATVVAARRRCRGARSPDRARRSAAALPLFDAASREYAYQRNQEMVRESAGISPTLDQSLRSRRGAACPAWRAARRAARRRAARRGPRRSSRGSSMEQLLDRATIIDPAVAEHLTSIRRRSAQRASGRDSRRRTRPTAGGHHHRTRPPVRSSLARAPADARRDPGRAWRDSFGTRLLLWKVDRDELAGSAASSTAPCRCRAGRTSGRCRSRTASTCSPPA